MLDDPLMDWLDKYHNNKEYGTKDLPKQKYDKSKNSAMNIMFKNGIDFEKHIVDTLKKKFPSQYVHIAESHKDLTHDNYKKTCDAIKIGVPIIFQAVFIDDKIHLHGIADMLVRSDFVNKMFNKEQLTEEESEKQEKKYVVIDIKSSVLELCVDGKTIRNSPNVSPYKGQLTLYNFMLGNVQKFYPPKAYILCKGWKYEKQKLTYTSESPFDSLGHIDFEKNHSDGEFIDKVRDAILWLDDMYENGHDWSPFQTEDINMMPNMGNTNDQPWNETKNEINCANKELTSIWRVGVKNRNIAVKKGIRKWTDERCTAQNLGINGKKIGPTIDAIIKINNSKNLVMPKKIVNNSFNWQCGDDNDYFVDFETMNEYFYNFDVTGRKLDSNFIFMIGCGHIVNNKWEFKQFIIDTITIEEEYRIVKEFTNYVGDNARLFHWGNAEHSTINIVNNKRQNNIFSDWIQKVTWIDMCSICTDEPIVFKGALNFKLKNVGKALKKNNLIQTTWKDDIQDGLTAMTMAAEYYTKNKVSTYCKNLEKSDKTIIDNIGSYNEIDCKTVQEIVEYLRNHHT
jgi:hypothetical protein